MCVRVCCGDQKSASGVPQGHPLHWFCLFVCLIGSAPGKPESHQVNSRDPLVSTLPALGTPACATVPDYLSGCWGSNSGPDAGL